MISKDELEYLAQISKINLSEDEAKKFPEQLDKTIEYIDILEELASDDSNVLDLQEMSFDELRDDVVRMSGGLRITKNLTEDGFLRGPKMK
ncbi:MAG: aspartyl/glutamyl-tRNA amidotransferase subunit C [Thaumarchaeota archaeon]|nr:MAG: aspartyl/glutamyl-tRNA amidotransferase subunit C [Nitrososphaerota archaeon]